MVKTRIRSAGGTNPGRVRSNNEDAFYADADRGIFLVVDGIGGQAAGEKAAEIAVSRVKARLERQTGTVEQRIREAIAVANNEILRAARANPEWAGMACVLTLAVLENGSAVVGHVGDSRLYHIRRGEIRKITHDHSPVGEREDAGELSESEAMRHPRRNEVFRDVGSQEHEPADANFIEVTRTPFEPDSALVLCSDGLSDLVASEEIRSTVEKHADDPDAAVERLIGAANRAGGKDNVTVIVVAGDEFRAPAPAPVPERRRSFLLPGIVLFLCGAVAAMGGAWLSRALWLPRPVVIHPRVLQADQQTGINSVLEGARPGDVVEVASGEYTEEVRLRNGVALRSSVPQAAILRVATTGPVVTAENVVGASLTGFRIVMPPGASASRAVLLVNSDVQLTDNDIQGGVEIRGGSSPVVRGNAIHDSPAEGLLISGPSQPWVSHNTFQKNQGPALAARDGAKPALVGNVFDKTSPELPPDVREHNFVLDSRAAASKAGKKK
jgi:serine/threonine protein phosphatase PrpC